jgi:hypothetical protein
MANRPGDGQRLQFIIKKYPEGAFSSQLDGGLAVGDRLTVRGPYGTCFRSGRLARPSRRAGGQRGAAVAADLVATAGQDRLSSQILALAVVAARQIERAFAQQTETEHLRLLEACLEEAPKYAEDGLIALDGKGRVLYVSHKAAQRLARRLSRSAVELKRGMQITSLDTPLRPYPDRTSTPCPAACPRTASGR